MAHSIIPPESQHLTTGWELGLAPDDTLVRRAVLANASMSVGIARGAGRPWRSAPRWAAGWIGDRGALTNFVVLLQPLTDPRSVIDEIGSLIPPHVPFVLVSAWPTTDLSGLGLALLGHPPLMVRFPTAAAASPNHPGVDVRQVRDAHELALAERVLVDGYPMPELEPLTPGDLLGPSILDGPTGVWLAWVDNTPVAVAAAHSHAGVTVVEYVAALTSARRLGAGSAVTWAATLAHPDQPAMLIASDEGRPVYERMGYQAIERWTAWLRPGEAAASTRP